MGADERLERFDRIGPLAQTKMVLPHHERQLGKQRALGFFGKQGNRPLVRLVPLLFVVKDLGEAEFGGQGAVVFRGGA